MLRLPEDFRMALAGHQPRSITEHIQAAYIEHLERRVAELEWLDRDGRLPFASKEPDTMRWSAELPKTLELPLRAAVELKPDDSVGFHVRLHGKPSEGLAISSGYYLSGPELFSGHRTMDILWLMHERVIVEFAQALAKR